MDFQDKLINNYKGTRIMKTVITLIITGIIFLAGCTDENNLITPEINQKAGPDWITLPAPVGGASVENEYSVTGVINGVDGGKLQINEIYLGGPYSTVRLGIKLTFPQNCFQGTETITMNVDMVHGTVTYSPSMQFDIPALLDLDFQGIDLSGIDADSINFVYHNPDGYFDIMESNTITVNTVNGTISMKDGKVPHFSRYGFSR